MGTEASHLYEGEGTVDRKLTAVVRGPLSASERDHVTGRVQIQHRETRMKR